MSNLHWNVCNVEQQEDVVEFKVSMTITAVLLAHNHLPGNSASFVTMLRGCSLIVLKLFRITCQRQPFLYPENKNGLQWGQCFWMNSTYCTSSRQQQNRQGLELLMLECRLSRLFRSPSHTDSQLRGISEASQSANSPSSLFTQKPAKVSRLLQPLFSRRELASCLPIYQRLSWLRGNASLAVLWRWISSSLLSPLASHRPYPLVSSQPLL